MKNLSVSEIKSLALYNKKTKSFPRIEWAITYLAYGESGRGLEGAKFELAMNFAREWKMNLVDFLIGKPVFGQPGQVHTRETAIKTADETFKKRYEQEVRAHASPTINNYFTREVGEMEYGRVQHENGTNEVIPQLERETQPLSWLPSKRYTPKARQTKNCAYFIRMLAKGHSPSKVLKNAKVCARNGAISWDDYNHLRDMAPEFVVQLAKSKPEMEVAL
jgi:hypothetical protein